MGESVALYSFNGVMHLSRKSPLVNIMNTYSDFKNDVIGSCLITACFNFLILDFSNFAENKFNW